MTFNWNKKRVFVSGGSGVIGTTLVTNLLKHGAEVFVGDLKPQPKDWKGKIGYRKGDLCTLTAKEISDFAPEIYFHLAATFERSEESYDFFEENFHHNVTLRHHLLSLLKDSKALKKIVFASSYLIYDPAQYLHRSLQKTPIILSEKEKIHPRNLCGMAKLMHEEELNFMQKFRPDLQITSARIFRSYGKNSRDVISRWIRALLNNEELLVFNPEGRFDFVFAEDVAEGLRKIAESSFSGIVNLGSGKSRSIKDLLSILKNLFRTIQIKIEPSTLPYEASQAQMDRFYKVIDGPFHFHSLEEAIPLIIDYEKNHK